MIRHLCISVTLLDPLFHGRADGDEPEWPPSPMRLYQALLAGSRLGCRNLEWNEGSAGAFRWLEAQRQPPIIIAPEATPAEGYILFVPNNDSDRKFERQDRLTSKIVKPHKIRHGSRFCGDLPAVHYLWPVEGQEMDRAQAYADLLGRAARQLFALGWGIDQAFASARLLTESEAASLPGERWRPIDNPSGIGYRVPTRGTLDDLVQKHEAFITRIGPDGFLPVRPLSAFRVVGYRRATDPPPRRWAAFRLRHPTEDRAAAFAQTSANRVAAMTRNATARIAWINQYVHGHRRKNDETSPRLSYLPLPSIERRGRGSTVLGAIRRVLVAELADSAEGYLPWVRQMLPGQFLTDEKLQDAERRKKALLIPLTGSDWVLRQYTDKADTWATG